MQTFNENSPEFKEFKGLFSFSNITCGVSCWEAKEENCVCSCGGKNHGIHRRGGTAERTAKIDGHVYRLVGVGKRREVYDAAALINLKAGFSSIQKVTETMTYHYTFRETDKGAPARLKYASKTRLEKWTELEPYRGAGTSDDICLVWERVEPLNAPKFCEQDCERCDRLRADALALEIKRS